MFNTETSARYRLNTQGVSTTPQSLTSVITKIFAVLSPSEASAQIHRGCPI